VSAAAGRYARALFALTRNEEQLRAQYQLLCSEPQLWSALRSPLVRRSEKHALLDRLLRGAEEPLLHFWKLLCDHDRLSEAPQVVEQFHRLLLQAQGRLPAVMRSAFPPTEAQRQAVCQALCRRLGCQGVELAVQEAPSLLGGFLVECEGVVYDRSLRGMLQEMKKQL
jgi:F-type H+-transporting ATPase subunit delta